MGKRGPKPQKAHAKRGPYLRAGSNAARSIRQVMKEEAKRLYDTMRGTGRYSPEQIESAFGPHVIVDFMTALKHGSKAHYPHKTTKATSAADRAIAAPHGPYDVEADAKTKGFSNGLELAAHVLATLKVAHRRAVDPTF